MAPPDLTARPLGLAEVIDRSVALGLRHFRPLFLTMLGIQAVALVLARQLPGLEVLAVVGDPVRAAELLQRASRTVALVTLALLFLQSLALGAVAVIVAPSLDPRRDAPRPSRSRAAAAVATASVLQVLLIAAAPVVGAVPGALLAMRAESLATAAVGIVGAVAGSLGLFLVATLRLMLAPAAAALEGRAGLAALARSSRLMSPRPGGRLLERPGVRASLVLLAMLVLAVAVDALAGIPRAIALRVQAGGVGLEVLGTQLSLPVDIVVSLLETVAGAALQPFSLVAMVVLYFDRRARREGLDLESWAERLEGGSA
jgi:hypothetical protein